MAARPVAWAGFDEQMISTLEVRWMTLRSAGGSWVLLSAKETDGRR